MVTPSLEWDTLDPRRFEQVCQMLVLAYTNDAATPIDGAGGDEAQDVLWDDPECGPTIFEVKSFKARLKSGQRKQVADSFSRAVALHQPARWVLITRSNPTPGEFRWLKQLPAPEGKEVRRDWFGVSWLERQLAASPGLLAHLMGPEHQLLKRIEEFDLDRKVLDTGAAVTEHEAKVRARRDEISPFWKIIAAEDPDGAVTRTLVAKNLYAAKLDPITINSTFQFPSGDPDAQDMSAALEHALKFGGSADVSKQYIEKFTVTTSSEGTQRLLGDLGNPGALRIGSIPDRSHLPATFTFKSAWPDGRITSIDIVVTHRYHGRQGTTLHGADASGIVSLALVVPHDLGGGDGRLHFTLEDTQGRYAHDAVPALAWMRACEENSSVDMFVGPLLMGTSSVDAGQALSVGTRALYRYALSLQEIGKVTGRLFRLPAALTDEQARPVVEVGHALLGGHTPMEEGGLEIKVSGELRSTMLLLPDQGTQMVFSHSVDLNIDAQSVTVPMSVYGQRLLLENRLPLSNGKTPYAVLKCYPDTKLALIRQMTEPPPNWKSLEGD